MSAAIDDEQARFAAVRADWLALTVVPECLIDEWEGHLQALRTEEAELRFHGLWVAGPTDLMGVLRLAFDEVRHCIVLGWLLNPEGAHGLGVRVLERLVEHCRPDYRLRPGQLVTVETEVTRALGTSEETRADVVVSLGDLTVVIEAKVLAGEQPRQAERLSTLWATGPDPRFVFLTCRPGALATTAGSYLDDWTPLSWKEVGAWATQALSETSNAAAGRRAVEEWLSTLWRVLA